MSRMLTHQSAVVYPRSIEFFPEWDKVANDLVALLRAEAGRDPYGRQLSDLIGEFFTRRATKVDLVKLRPMLQVRDVEVSSRWYQTTIGLRSGHGGDEFEMLFAGDDFVLQLHRLDAHEHGLLQPDPDALLGGGVSLWFETVDRQAFDSLIGRARSAGATIAAEPNWNPLAHHHESTLIDPDGYIVIINTPFDPTA